MDYLFWFGFVSGMAMSGVLLLVAAVIMGPMKEDPWEVDWEDERAYGEHPHINMEADVKDET